MIGVILADSVDRKPGSSAGQNFAGNGGAGSAASHQKRALSGEIVRLGNRRRNKAESVRVFPEPRHASLLSHDVDGSGHACTNAKLVTSCISGILVQNRDNQTRDICIWLQMSMKLEKAPGGTCKEMTTAFAPRARAKAVRNLGGLYLGNGINDPKKTFVSPLRRTFCSVSPLIARLA